MMHMRPAVFLKRTDGRAISPTKATRGSACLDLHALEDADVSQGTVTKVRTGLVLDHMDSGYRIDVRPRSGLAANHGVVVANSPGTIDESYRGELLVLLTKVTPGVHKVRAGDRVAQICIEKVMDFELIVDDASVSVESDDERVGGLGSTGK